jgi:hypothetical protein
MVVEYLNFVRSRYRYIKIWLSNLSYWSSELLLEEILGPSPITSYCIQDCVISSSKILITLSSQVFIYFSGKLWKFLAFRFSTKYLVLVNLDNSEFWKRISKTSKTRRKEFLKNSEFIIWQDGKSYWFLCFFVR